MHLFPTKDAFRKCLFWSEPCRASEQTSGWNALATQTPLKVWTTGQRLRAVDIKAFISNEFRWRHPLSKHLGNGPPVLPSNCPGFVQKIFRTLTGLAPSSLRLVETCISVVTPAPMRENLGKAHCDRHKLRSIHADQSGS